MNSRIVHALLSDLENPRAVVEELWVFRHWVVARTDRFAVVSIPNATTRHLCCGNSDISGWRGRPVSEVIKEGLSSPEVVLRAAAMACLNGSLRMAPSGFEGNAVSPFSERVKHEKSCFIGHFEEGARWREAGYPVTIVELEPREKDIHWKDADDALGQASLVFITGLTLLNDTFSQVVERTPNAVTRVLMGPTVPPSARFLDFGVHVIGGTVVENPALLLRYFQYGGTSIKKAPSGAVSRFNIVDPTRKLEASFVV